MVSMVRMTMTYRRMLTNAPAIRITRVLCIRQHMTLFLLDDIVVLTGMICASFPFDVRIIIPFAYYVNRFCKVFLNYVQVPAFRLVFTAFGQQIS